MDGVGNNWTQWIADDGVPRASDGDHVYILQNNQWSVIGPVQPSGSSVPLNQQDLSSLSHTGHMSGIQASHVNDTQIISNYDESFDDEMYDSIPQMNTYLNNFTQAHSVDAIGAVQHSAAELDAIKKYLEDTEKLMSSDQDEPVAAVAHFQEKSVSSDPPNVCIMALAYDSRGFQSSIHLSPENITSMEDAHQKIFMALNRSLDAAASLTGDNSTGEDKTYILLGGTRDDEESLMSASLTAGVVNAKPNFLSGCKVVSLLPSSSGDNCSIDAILINKTLHYSIIN